MIALLYDADAEEGDEAARDVFEQLDAIEPILAEEHETRRVGVTLNLAELRRTLLALRPSAVFNLVESVGGADRLQTLVPLLLEELRIPFTGCGSVPMLLSNDKPAGKSFLAARGLPVPASISEEKNKSNYNDDGNKNTRSDWIVKAVAAHASLHLSDASVLRNATREEVEKRIREERKKHGPDFFAEKFIDGREFNISLLAREGGGVDVLPPAEMDFSKMPAAAEKIVGYAAKWSETSAEYAGSERRFDFPEEDASLLAALSDIAQRAWRAMGLTGYARVDFRVSKIGQPHILEVNANPCLTPGAGFPAAAARSGLSYPSLIRRIRDAALPKCAPPPGRAGMAACKRA